ncbi:MAG: bifunctional oligoribonuclease/PAP phosphatase NrnA [Deltaproteobacteria bacterium]|nr:bifunctional oligoribonuclease/PAP phosphatase NrnA [Deltaproteobacteria bacterium]
MTKATEISKIAEELLKAQKCLVLSHYNPDGDALGSSLAVANALQNLGKEVVSYNESHIPEKYHFLPGSKQIVSTLPEASFDMIVVCDCGDVSRMGDLTSVKLGNHSTILNIDHHISNTNFGTYNLVETERSSTAEIVYNLLSEMKVEITPDIASCLFTGILTDTGSFRYQCTGVETFNIAAELLKFGARAQEVAHEIYERRSRASVLLCSSALANMKFHKDGKVAEVFVSKEMMDSFSATADDTEGLVEEARAVDGVLVSVFIREQDGIWRISLRSSDPDHYDVSQVASSFGGGGHKAAAAFRSKRALEDFRPALIEKLEQLVS